MGLTADIRKGSACVDDSRIQLERVDRTIGIGIPWCCYARRRIDGRDAAPRLAANIGELSAHVDNSRIDTERVDDTIRIGVPRGCRARCRVERCTPQLSHATNRS